MTGDTLDALLLALLREPDPHERRLTVAIVGDRLLDLGHPAAPWWPAWADDTLGRSPPGWRIGRHILLRCDGAANARFRERLFPGGLDLFRRLDRLAAEAPAPV